MKRSFLALLLLVTAVVANASPGDVVIMVGPSGSQIGFFSPGGVAGTWDGSGKSKTSFITGSNAAFDVRGHAFTVGAFLTEFDDTATLPAYTLVRKTPLPEPGVAVVADGLGGAYVLGASATMYYYDEAGVLKRQFALPGIFFFHSSTVSIDIDGPCTLAYSVPGLVLAGGVSITRFDACTMQPLAPLGDGKPFDAFRLLRDGFVAARGGTLLFYDADGKVVQSRTLTFAGSIPAIAFAPEPGYVWIAIGTNAEKRRLSDGAVVAHITTSPPVAGLAVNGERRPSIFDLVGGRRRPARH